MVARQQKHDVVGQLHGVLQEGANLAPGRIGDDPVHRFRPREEIPAAPNFTPAGAARQAVQYPPLPATGLKHPPPGPEVPHQHPREDCRGLHLVVADVITVGLEAHWLPEVQLVSHSGFVLKSPNPRPARFTTKLAKGTRT